jgi:hypothetical protein
MDITLDYRHIEASISKKESFFGRILLRFFDKYKKKKLSQLDVHLSEAIKGINEAMPKIDKLNADDAKEMSLNLQLSLKKFKKAYSNLDELGVFKEDIHLHNKFKNLLDLFYKAEAMAHKTAFKAIKVEKTNSELKSGSVKIAKTYFNSI